MIPARSEVSKVLLVAMMLICVAAEALAAERSRIAIVKTRNLEQFNLGVQGFKRAMAESGRPYQLREFSLSDGRPEVAQRMRQFKPDLIVPFGSTATTFAQQQFGNLPIVFAMVLYPATSGIGASKPSSNMTGVAMDIPLLKQFETIRDVIPRTNRIGVIYDPNQTGAIIDEARIVVRSLAMELVPIRVASEKDVPAALEGIERRVDVLWSVADSTVFTPTTTEYIIAYCLQHNLPFMGLSTEFAEGGSLFALGQDFFDIGREAGASAIRVMAGARAGDLEIKSPRKTSLIVNLRVAEEIGVSVPASVIRNAARVIR